MADLPLLLVFCTAVLFVTTPFGAGAALAIGAAWRGHPAVRVTLFGYAALVLVGWAWLVMGTVR